MRCVLRLLAGLSTFLILASAVAEDSKSGSAKPSVPTSPAPAAVGTAHIVANGAEDGLHVHLAVDGNMAGRVFTYDDSGVAQSTRARIALLRGGQVIATTRADEWGRFQIIGIQPGVYSILAAADDRLAVAAIRVIPFEQNGINNPSVLHIGLAPANELDMLKGMLGPVPPAAAAAPAPTPAAAGGGGGGGGLGGLLGAAGMGLGAAGLGGGGEGGAGGGNGPSSLFLPAGATPTSGQSPSTNAAGQNGTAP